MTGFPKTSKPENLGWDGISTFPSGVPSLLPQSEAARRLSAATAAPRLLTCFHSVLPGARIKQPYMCS